MTKKEIQMEEHISNLIIDSWNITVNFITNKDIQIEPKLDFNHQKALAVLTYFSIIQGKKDGTASCTIEEYHDIYDRLCGLLKLISGKLEIPAKKLSKIHLQHIQLT